MERTSDLVSKVRKMREAAEKEMNRFTRVDDYDVRRVVGRGPKSAPVSSETASPSPASGRLKPSTAKTASAQTSIGFDPLPAENGDEAEGA